MKLEVNLFTFYLKFHLKSYFKHFTMSLANFTICCKYPGLVIWKWQAEECEYECRNVRRIHLRCCMLPCLFRKLGVLKFSEDPSVKPDVGM